MNSDNKCKACTDTMHNCLTCDSATHCTDCVDNVTTLFLGTCQCNTDKNWLKVTNQQDTGFC